MAGRVEMTEEDVESYARTLVDEGAAADMTVARSIMANPASWPLAEG